MVRLETATTMTAGNSTTSNSTTSSTAPKSETTTTTTTTTTIPLCHNTKSNHNNKAVSVSEFVDASFSSFDRVYGVPTTTTKKSTTTSFPERNNNHTNNHEHNDNHDNHDHKEEDDAQSSSSSLGEMIVTWYLPIMFFWIRKSMWGTANLIRSLVWGHFVRMVFQQFFPASSTSTSTTTTTTTTSSSWLWDHLSPWLTSLWGGGEGTDVNKPDPHAWPPPAFTTLAVLTILAFVVHPDGPTWILWGKIRDGIVSLGQSICAMVRDYGIIPTMFAATTLAALGFLLQIMRRTLKHKKLESNQRTSSPTSKKKKRKGHGRGGGGHHGGGNNHRGRIKSSGGNGNNSTLKPSHATTTTTTSTIILTTKPIPERKAVHEDEHDDVIVGNVSLTNSSCECAPPKEAVSPARQRMMSSSTAETFPIADDQSCGSTSVRSISSAPTIVTSSSLSLGAVQESTGKITTTGKKEKKKPSRNSKRRQKGKRPKKPNNHTPGTPTTANAPAAGAVVTTASASSPQGGSSSNNSATKHPHLMAVSTSNNFESSSSKAFSTDAPFSHSPFAPVSPTLSASSVPTPTELTRRDKNRRSTPQQHPKRNKNNNNNNSNNNTGHHQNVVVAPPPGLASSKSLMQPTPYHHRPLSTTTTTNNKHPQPHHSALSQPLLSSPYHPYSNNAHTEQQPQQQAVFSSSTSLRPAAGGAQPYRHPNSSSRGTTTSIPPGMTLSGSISQEATLTAATQNIINNNNNNNNNNNVPSSPPVRYNVPNYSNYYAHDARYTPGKMELAAFLAQVGLVGTACAKMLHDLENVDALLNLTDAQYRSYNISSAKQAQMSILLDARRETKVTEQPQKDSKLIGSSSNDYDIDSTFAPLPPPSPGLSSSTGGNTPVRPPPGLEATGPSSFLLAGVTNTTNSTTDDDSILPLMPSILQQQQHSSLSMSPTNWETDNFVSMISSPSPSPTPSLSPTSMLLPRMEDGCKAASLYSDVETSTMETTNDATDFLGQLAVTPSKDKPSRTLFGTPFEQDEQLQQPQQQHQETGANYENDDDESSQIEADLQELGGQMVGSILDF